MLLPWIYAIVFLLNKLHTNNYVWSGGSNRYISTSLYAPLELNPCRQQTQTNFLLCCQFLPRGGQPIPQPHNIKGGGSRIGRPPTTHQTGKFFEYEIVYTSHKYKCELERWANQPATVWNRKHKHERRDPLLIMNGREDPCVNCKMRTYGEAPALSLNGGPSYTIVGRKTPTREEMQHGLCWNLSVSELGGYAPACVLAIDGGHSPTFRVRVLQ